LNDPERLSGLTKKAAGLAIALGPQSPFAKIYEDLTVVFRLIGHLCAGTYRRFPTQSLLLVVAGLLYLVWPFDLVPDAILALGWLDDATVLAFVLRSVKLDLDAFKQWERESPAHDTQQSVCLD